MISTSDLPIEDVLPEVLQGLALHPRLVITAPPGAGKTTRVPLALLEQPWIGGGDKLILVEPRRIAARAAAERMAKTLAERVGQTIGLRSRLDVRTSAASRIEVVTEGVFTRMILSDPALEGIAGVIFDEFHERSLEADEGLAFALDAQSVLREDLRIVIMSATLPPDLTTAFFDAPRVSSDGRAHPVRTVYLGFETGKRLEDQMALAIRRALMEETGSILAFLPGVAEIRRMAERLTGLAPGVVVDPLYGALSPAEQNAAIAPAPAGIRKIVLATDIAESSLTIEGVRVVIDSGFARVPRFDVNIGISRLETVRVSIANADQRRGRAGRTEPGVCYRLWREAETRSLTTSPAAEIENADLTGLCLDLARWGVKSPEALRWLTPPRQAGWNAARLGLMASGAIDASGGLTDFGQRIAAIALPPRLAAMVLRAGEADQAGLAADIAALMSERELGGRSVDLDQRLARFRADNNARARAMRDIAQRWAKQAGGARRSDAPTSAGALLAAAFPERIARARMGAPGRFQLASGRGALLDETDALARAPWLAVADLTGGGADLRITLAAWLSEDDAERFGQPVTEETARYDPASRSIRARRTRRIGAIVLEDAALQSPGPELVRDGLLEAVREQGLTLIPEIAPLLAHAARVSFLSTVIGEPWPSDYLEHLSRDLNSWLAPALGGIRSLDRLSGVALAEAAQAALDWRLQRDLSQLAPTTWTTPTGRSVVIDYGAEGGPRAACRVQEAYGLKVHPLIAGGRIALTLSLLSPAQRPVATTRDLPGFWSAGYHDMRRDMRGRYPKHDWPEDPASALPVSRPQKRSS